MRFTALLLAYGTMLPVLPAQAHITEVPHAHPHLVDFGVGQGAAVAGLLMLSVLLFWSASRIVGRRHK